MSQAPPMPQWVKVMALVALAMVVLAVVLALAGGHEPGRHVP